MAGTTSSLQAPPASVEGRVLLSIGLVVVLVLGAWLARALRRRVALDGHADRLLNVGLAGAVAGIAIGAGYGFVRLWGGSAVVDATLTGLGVDDPLVLAIRSGVTVLVLVGSYLLTGVIKRAVDDFARDRTAVTRHQTELAFRSTQLGVYVLAVVVVLGIWRVDLGGLLVGAVFLGIVVGLAARQTLGALIAGFVLMVARPFEIGDWVQIGDGRGS